jgi:hypothetical protein
MPAPILILLIFLAVCIAVLLVAACSVCFGIFPTKIKPDFSRIKPIPTNVRLVGIDKATGAFQLEKMNSDGSFADDFKIVAFSDMHFDGGLRGEKDKALANLCEQIETQKPDLVVLLGDMALVWFNGTRTKELTAILDGYGVWWTSVLGNHEGESRMEVSRKKVVEIQKTSAHCLANVAINGVAGYGNQIINIMAAKNKIAQCLYLLDSGGAKKLSHYNIQASQTAWYDQTLRTLEETYGTFRSMIWMHMPVYEYKLAWDAIEAGAANAKLLWGARGESVCCAPTKTDSHGIVDKAKERGSTWAFVCGHDHANNFGVEYDGMTYIYNQTGGFSSWAFDARTQGMRGCNVFTIHGDGSVDVKAVLASIQ